MNQVISRRFLFARWGLEETVEHTLTLTPFLLLHEIASRRSSDETGRRAKRRWAWEESAAVEACLTLAWQMAGRWQARRAVTVSRQRFDAVVLRVVPWLARRLNLLGVHSLRDVSRLSRGHYTSAVTAVHVAVREISAIRRTKTIEPVLGSKVLHHFFPSIVPAFDRRWIRNEVLSLDSCRQYLGSGGRGRRLWQTDVEAQGASLLAFHEYFVLCVSHVGEATRTELQAVRMRFSKAFQDLAPAAFVKAKGSLLFRLDAKIAEYCLLGWARRSKR